MATPLAQEGARHGGLGGEDGDRDGALAGGQVLGALGDHVITVEALVLDALVAQELRQALCSRDCAALAPCSVTLYLATRLTYGRLSKPTPACALQQSFCSAKLAWLQHARVIGADPSNCVGTAQTPCSGLPLHSQIIP